MKWLFLSAVVCALAISGCQGTDGQQSPSDPLFGPTQVPPPPTGAAGAVDPYYSQPQQGQAAPPAPNAAGTGAPIPGGASTQQGNPTTAVAGGSSIAIPAVARQANPSSMADRNSYNKVASSSQAGADGWQWAEETPSGESALAASEPVENTERRLPPPVTSVASRDPIVRTIAPRRRSELANPAAETSRRRTSDGWGTTDGTSENDDVIEISELPPVDTSRVNRASFTE